MSIANPSQKPAIFGMQYIEDEDASLLDVVGCGGVQSAETGGGTTIPSVTIKLCGDGFDRSADELEPAT